MLDDPLAAVDADVAHHLMEKCILGILRNKTRILCTHRIEFVEKADMVMLMDGGMVVKTGSIHNRYYSFHNHVQYIVDTAVSRDAYVILVVFEYVYHVQICCLSLEKHTDVSNIGSGFLLVWFAL